MTWAHAPFTLVIDLSTNQNQTPFEKKFACLAARAVFGSNFIAFRVNELLLKYVLYKKEC